MFETVISEITNFVRRTVGAIASATRRAPWLVMVAVALAALLW